MRMSEGEVRDEMNWIDLLPPIRSRPSNDYPSPAVIVGEPAADKDWYPARDRHMYASHRLISLG